MAPFGAETILALGVIFLLGLVADVLGRRTPLPRATLLVLVGLLLGPEMLDQVPISLTQQFELIASVALVMIGFLLGGRLTRENLLETGRMALWVSAVGAIGTAFVVAPALWLAGLPLGIAILLACIASATAPATTIDVVNEHAYDSPLARTLVQSVALDDAWGLMLFSLGLASVGIVLGNGGEASDVATHLLRDIGGGIALGLALGLPAAVLTGRIHPGQPIRLEAIALVLICSGLAIQFEVSLLIAAMVMGMTVANLAAHHEYPFHEIEGMEGLVMTVFFLLAGATLQVDALLQAGWIGVVYVAARSVGKTAASRLGVQFAGRRARQRIPGVERIGAAMLPQAGAAIGMALIAAKQLPPFSQTILAVVIGTTVIFEVLGPIATRYTLSRAETASQPYR